MSLQSILTIFLIIGLLLLWGCKGSGEETLGIEDQFDDNPEYPFEVFFLDRKSIPPPAHPSLESIPELTFTADIYVLDHTKKLRFGPYDGSTFPDNKKKNSKQPRTVLPGRYLFNNKYGHKGSMKRGLNLVDEKGDRFTDAKPWTGPPDKAQNINVHNGGTGKGYYYSRYSQGCLTIDKDTIDDFMNLFEWTVPNSEGKLTSGTSSGWIYVVRTTESERQDFIKEIESVYVQG